MGHDIEITQITIKFSLVRAWFIWHNVIIHLLICVRICNWLKFAQSLLQEIHRLAYLKCTAE